MPNFRNQFNSAIAYSNSYPKLSLIRDQKDLKECHHLFLVYDRALLKQGNFVQWKEQFTLEYGVDGGEDLKNLANLQDHIESIADIIGDFPASEVLFVVVGGGSIGDFAGFIASIFKRGIKWVQIPTTWLSAMDSSHGGKTALNVGGVKNQIGSYHPSAAVILVREAFSGLSDLQLKSGFGELVKMALLTGGFFYRNMLECEDGMESCMWQFLSRAIAGKYKVVKKDPYEEKGERRVLNFGHTFGHALEAHEGLPHGVAIAWGIRFALNWSRKRNYMTKSKYTQICEELDTLTLYKKNLMASHIRMSADELREYLLKDKKRTKRQSLNFVFLISPGKPVVKSVTIQQIVTEAIRQGWVDQ